MLKMLASASFDFFKVFFLSVPTILCRVAMREADARMLDYQGPAQNAKIASDRQIFGRAACGARAGPISALSGPPAAFPPPYRTLSTPTPDQLV